MADQSPSTINVINPDGKLVSLPEHQVQDAVQNGYKIPSPSEEKELKTQDKFGEGLGNELKAGVAGAARGATFGLSDQALTKTGLADPETLSNLEKYNPVASGVGEAAGAIAPALLTEGASTEASAARVAGAPVRAVSEAGQAITKAAKPLADGVASVVANPETSPIAHKIISSGLAHGVGSAVEGAAYGLGQTVSEDALGDHDLNAEKVMSNIGYSALLGGALGTAFGGVSGALSKAEPTARDALNQAGIAAPNDFATTVKLGAGPEKESILGGLKKLKGNVGDIGEAANELGVPTFAGQVSDSDATQKAWSMMSQSPTAFGVSEKQGVDQALSKIQDTVGQVFGNGENGSGTLAETGEKLKQSISDKMAERYQPIKQAYSELKDAKADINLTPEAKTQLKNSLYEVISDNKLAPRSAGREFISSLADGIDEMGNLGDIQDYSQNFYKSAGLDSKFAASAAKNKVDSVVDDLIKQVASKTQDPAQKAVVEGLTDKLMAARGQYKGLINDMEELGAVTGKKNVGGPQGFLNHIDEIGPEKLAERLFQKKNSNFIQSFAQKFPEEWETLKGFQKNKIFQANLKDGSFNLNGSLKEVYKYEPELRRALFDDGELRKLSAAKTYMESFPKNYNPSQSAVGLGWMSFLKNPIDAGAQTLRDFALSKGFKSITESVGGSQSVQTLSKIERMTQNTSKSIMSASKAVFSATPTATSAVNAYAYKDHGHEHISNMVDELAQNPDKLIQQLHDATSPVYGSAPKIAGSMQMATVRATQFLSAKIPKNPNPRPMSPKFIPSKAETAKFQRYYHTIQNPVGVMHGLKTGMIMPEQMETLNAVYPTLLQHMQSQVMEQLTTFMAKGEPNALPYKKKMALSMFLGSDLDSALEQQSIASNQMLMTGQQSGEDQLAKPTQAGMQNLSMASRIATPMQSLASGGNTDVS